MKRYTLLLTLLVTLHVFAQDKTTIARQIQTIIDSANAVSGVCVIDATTGEEVFAVNEHQSFTQASAIKIPILMELYKQAREKKIDLMTIRAVSAKDKIGGSGILQSFADDVTLSVRDLAMLMVTQSDNAATNILIDMVGMQNVTHLMQSLGMTNTKLQRKMMDTEAAKQGRENVSTPSEAAHILYLLYKGKFVDAALSNEIIDVLKKNARKNSRVAASLPGKVEVAFKPGALPDVSTEWTIVYAGNHPYIIAFMEKFKGATYGNSLERISKLVYNYFTLPPLRIVDKPVVFDKQRQELSIQYMKERHGIVTTAPYIKPRMIVLHWTAIPTLEQSFNAMNPAILPGARQNLATASTLNVAAQFLIDKDGTVYRQLPDTAFARHVIGLNYCAIGVENVGGVNNEPLTKEQLIANEQLIRYLKFKYPDIEYVIGHYEYKLFDGTPLWKEADSSYRTTKNDPGEDFMKRVRADLSDLNLKGAPVK
ncbi:MAG: serine hydrolase [Filimonas sp.]|nr:serine hydrolase [Filimonas sp.]